MLPPQRQTWLVCCHACMRCTSSGCRVHTVANMVCVFACCSRCSVLSCRDARRNWTAGVYECLVSAYSALQLRAAPLCALLVKQHTLFRPNLQLELRWLWCTTCDHNCCLPLLPAACTTAACRCCCCQRTTCTTWSTGATQQSHAGTLPAALTSTGAACRLLHNSSMS